jgi:hypothetical protein
VAAVVQKAQQETAAQAAVEMVETLHLEQVELLTGAAAQAVAVRVIRAERVGLEL